MVQLHINGQLAEIDQSVSIPITFRYDELMNPTIITSNFSKTVSLPVTKINNQIFNSIYRLDQLPYDFDAKKRVPFVLSWNNSVIESGFIKLNEVLRNGKDPYRYNITLNGGLGDFFYTIAEKYMEDLEVEEERFNHNITADAVVNTWRENNQYYKYALTYSGKYDNFESGVIDGTGSYDRYNDVNVVNFGNLDRDLFQYIAVGTLFLATSPTGENFLNQLQNKTYFFRAVTPLYKTDQLNPTPGPGLPIVIVGSHVIALDATGTGNFVVYPTTYNLFDVTSTGNQFYAVGDGIAIHSTTGESGSWRENVGLVGVRLKSVCIDENNYGWAAGEDGAIYNMTVGVGLWDRVNYVRSSPNDGADLDFNCIYPDGNGRYILGSDGWYHYYELSSNMLISFKYPGLNVKGATHNGTNFFLCGEYTDSAGNVSGRIIEVRVPLGSATEVYSATRALNTIKYTEKRGFICLGDKILLYSTGDPDKGEAPGKNWGYGSNLLSPSDIPSFDEHQFYEYRSYYQRPVLRMQYLIDQIFTDSGFTVNKHLTFFNVVNPYWNNAWVTMDRLTPSTNDLPEENVGNIRSGDPVTYKLMVKKGVTQYDFMMYYLKNFGLIFDRDKISNTITIHTRNSYFVGYEIIDWTNKLDYSKNLINKPLPFDFKYALLKWNENDTFYEKEYRTKYNREYGEVKIDTGYMFNKNENNLIDNDTYINGVISQEWDEYFVPSQGYRHDKILPAFFTKNNNERTAANGSMCVLFYDGMASTGTNRFAISDDTIQMRKDMKYYWTFDYKTLYTEYPLFTRLHNYGGEPTLGFSLDFAKPQEAYYSGVPDETYTEGATIYSRYWKEYIEERYNDENKVMTAYFYLTPVDINNFRFNKFIRLHNTLWHVRKITDYDVTQPNRSTKVELVRVNNIRAYTLGQHPLIPNEPAPAKVKAALFKDEPAYTFKLDIKND